MTGIYYADLFIAINKITTTNKQPKTNRSNPIESPKKKQY